jgi:hypothetical protein
MHDKTFVQALQDLQDRISNDLHGSLGHMLMHGSTVSSATSDIEDERIREVVKNTLITGQMIALFTMMKELNILDEAQCEEFIAHVKRSLTSTLYMN